MPEVMVLFKLFTSGYAIRITYSIPLHASLKKYPTIQDTKPQILSYDSPEKESVVCWFMAKEKC